MKALRLLTIVSLALAVVGGAGWICEASQAGKAMNEADTALNAAYKRALDGLPSAALKEQLKTSQRAWVAFAEAETALHAQLYDGSKGGLFIRLELTETRAKQLASIAARTSENGYDIGR